MTREEFIAIARTWIGTPYHNQARLKGVGADCIGFVAGAVSEAAGRRIETPISYGRYPQAAVALAALHASGEVTEIKLEDAQPGDVIYMRIAREPQHFGILTQDGGIVHCLDGVGVVEVFFADWMRERVSHVFRLNFLGE